MLIREAAPQVLEELHRLLSRSGLSTETRDDIAFGLMRRGFEGARDDCVAQVKSALDDDRPSAVRLLATLSRVDREEYLKLASRFLVRRLAGGTSRSVDDSTIAAFIYNLPEGKNKLLFKLLSYMHSLNAAAARRFQARILEYLDNEWIQRQLGAERIAALKRQALL